MTRIDGSCASRLWESFRAGFNLSCNQPDPFLRPAIPTEPIGTGLDELRRTRSAG